MMQMRLCTLVPYTIRYKTGGSVVVPFRMEAERDLIVARLRDSDGIATAAINEDLSVPKDCQARAESIAQNPASRNHP